MTFSDAINDAVRLAEARGNAVLGLSAGWSKVQQVLHMRDALSDVLRSELLAERHLRHWTSGRTPHDPAQEGLIDDIRSVAVVLPWFDQQAHQ